MKLLIIFLLTASAGMVLAIPVNAQKIKEPNILIIYADDMGYETVNAYGGLDFKTPNIDKMANEGLMFESAYTSPVCTPSRVSLHTGLYAAQHGFKGVLPVHRGTGKQVDFENRFTTFAQLLREKGYRTSVSGKWQLATLEKRPGHIKTAGFDRWCVWQIWKDGTKTSRYWAPVMNQNGKVRDDIAEKFGPDVLVDFVIGEMRTAVKKDEPFLIVHNELMPHFPIVQTPVDRKLDRSAAIGNMINYLDELVAKLLKEVEELGIRDNTYVIFMADNGTQEMYFQNPGCGKPDEKKHTRHTIKGRVNGGKFELNDAGTHVPLVIWGAGIAKGRIISDIVDVVDLFPTICDLTDTKIPRSLELDGYSIKGLIKGKKSTPRTWTQGGIKGRHSIFDGNWRVRSDGQVIDARDLPNEKEIIEPTDESKAARERLSQYFEASGN